ncbi:PCMD domain-containing protein [Myroides sp. N17-2]|uniref:PCMD domain-containing protein n=1 Tax=Myroides sp. N17-2 TaxID=2030799 RepID=UPI000EFAB990|nr:PCMD domain-containing protein [Myroides sp. N17-2]
MRIKYLLFTLITIIGITFSSCIKDEAETMESDIASATIQDADKYLLTIPTITNNNVFFRLQPDIDERDFAPMFKLSNGATISPENGSKQNFSKGPVQYTITSQDGRWKKIYNVSFLTNTFITYYDFENVKTVVTESPEGKYHEFFERLPDGFEKYDWTSGNEGYNMLAETLLEEGQELSPAVYPTASTEEGYKGKGVKMVTKGTGPLGNMMGSPIAAGNLYLGTFQFTFPAIKSTRFGIPYSTGINMPKSLKGHYKYKAGKDFTVTSKQGSALTKDAWDAYAIIFEKGDNPKKEFLAGDHKFLDPRMVAIARLDNKDRVETDRWTKFEIPFKMVDGKIFDPKAQYMIAIVFSASVEGDVFNGAVGSTLYIDEVELDFDK